MLHTHIQPIAGLRRRVRYLGHMLLLPSGRGKSLTRTSSLSRTPTTVADHGYTADSGSILIARCRHLLAGLARSIVCNLTVWHNVAEWLRAWDTLTMFEATVCGRS